MNAILGFSGNLLTILAIPYAAKKQKFNLHRNWPLTIFILNLAIADFLYSSINLPLYALQYIYKGWFWGEYLVSKEKKCIKIISACSIWYM